MSRIVGDNVITAGGSTAITATGYMMQARIMYLHSRVVDLVGRGDELSQEAADDIVQHCSLFDSDGAITVLVRMHQAQMITLDHRRFSVLAQRLEIRFVPR